MVLITIFELTDVSAFQYSVATALVDVAVDIGDGEITSWTVV